MPPTPPHQSRRLSPITEQPTPSSTSSIPLPATDRLPPVEYSRDVMITPTRGSGLLNGRRRGNLIQPSSSSSSPAHLQPNSLNSSLLSSPSSIRPISHTRQSHPPIISSDIPLLSPPSNSTRPGGLPPPPRLNNTRNYQTTPPPSPPSQKRKIRTRPAPIPKLPNQKMDVFSHSKTSPRSSSLPLRNAGPVQGLQAGVGTPHGIQSFRLGLKAPSVEGDRPKPTRRKTVPAIKEMEMIRESEEESLHSNITQHRLTFGGKAVIIPPGTPILTDVTPSSSYMASSSAHHIEHSADRDDYDSDTSLHPILVNRNLANDPLPSLGCPSHREINFNSDVPKKLEDEIDEDDSPATLHLVTPPQRQVQTFAPVPITPRLGDAFEYEENAKTSARSAIDHSEESSRSVRTIAGFAFPMTPPREMVPAEQRETTINSITTLDRSKSISNIPKLAEPRPIAQPRARKFPTTYLPNSAPAKSTTFRSIESIPLSSSSINLGEPIETTNMNSKTRPPGISPPPRSSSRSPHFATGFSPSWGQQKHRQNKGLAITLHYPAMVDAGTQRSKMVDEGTQVGSSLPGSVDNSPRRIPGTEDWLKPLLPPTGAHRDSTDGTYTINREQSREDRRDHPWERRKPRPLSMPTSPVDVLREYSNPSPAPRPESSLQSHAPFQVNETPDVSSTQSRLDTSDLLTKQARSLLKHSKSLRLRSEMMEQMALESMEGGEKVLGLASQSGMRRGHHDRLESSIVRVRSIPRSPFDAELSDDSTLDTGTDRTNPPALHIPPLPDGTPHIASDHYTSHSRPGFSANTFGPMKSSPLEFRNMPQSAPIRVESSPLETKPHHPKIVFSAPTEFTPTSSLEAQAGLQPDPALRGYTIDQIRPLYTEVWEKSIQGWNEIREAEKVWTKGMIDLASRLGLDPPTITMRHRRTSIPNFDSISTTQTNSLENSTSRRRKRLIPVPAALSLYHSNLSNKFSGRPLKSGDNPEITLSAPLPSGIYDLGRTVGGNTGSSRTPMTFLYPHPHPHPDQACASQFPIDRLNHPREMKSEEIQFPNSRSDYAQDHSLRDRELPERHKGNELDPYQDLRPYNFINSNNYDLEISHDPSRIPDIPTRRRLHSMPNRSSSSRPLSQLSTTSEFSNREKIVITPGGHRKLRKKRSANLIVGGTIMTAPVGSVSVGGEGAVGVNGWSGGGEVGNYIRNSVNFNLRDGYNNGDGAIYSKKDKKFNEGMTVGVGVSGARGFERRKRWWWWRG